MKELYGTHAMGETAENLVSSSELVVRTKTPLHFGRSKKLPERRSAEGSVWRNSPLRFRSAKGPYRFCGGRIHETEYHP